MEIKKEILEQIKESEKEIRKMTYRMYYNKSKVLNVNNRCIIVLDDVDDYLKKVETNPIEMDNTFTITVCVDGKDYKGKYSINDYDYYEQNIQILNPKCPYNVLLGFYSDKDYEDIYADSAFLDFVVYEKPVEPEIEVSFENYSNDNVDVDDLAKKIDEKIFNLEKEMQEDKQNYNIENLHFLD